MKVHELKTWPFYFDLMWRGLKAFEWRRDDRGFCAGDTVRLCEWSPSEGYSGRALGARINLVLGNEPPPMPQIGIPEGYVILGLVDVERLPRIERPGPRLVEARRG